ncbi:acyl- N-acyltransferase [Pyrrhoderma noxium]|uniref:Acyl-N-acyltransferase n=1 Tax=Pyrrhoderma noxium TaxID=2282107 RepID=A0A286UXB2_9AGAM|nr:acyl- N-acyltransferase [Pyrrhoderma noxium]
MSAYGALLKSSQSPKGVLAPTVWKVDNVSRRKTEGSESEQQGQTQEGKKTGEIVMFHLTLETAPGDLVGYMSDEFLEELARGRTYPQELIIKTEEGEEKQVYGRREFEGYFFAGDVLVGLLVDSEERVIDSSSEGGKEGKEVDPTQVTLEGVRRGREWKECVTGFYYVKPNYPGRSSHICNGGFVVPHASRGKGFARILARSYLHYAPRLGFSASVFNLVFVDNVASIRLWEALGFEKVGRIPKAGRLRRKDGEGEEYVDAWVIHKEFDPIN